MKNKKMKKLTSLMGKMVLLQGPKEIQNQLANLEQANQIKMKGMTPMKNKNQEKKKKKQKLRIIKGMTMILKMKQMKTKQNNWQKKIKEIKKIKTKKIMTNHQRM